MYSTTSLITLDPLTKFLNAREKAEQKAKERIDRLNDLIQKWQVKERKREENLLEIIAEKRMKSDINRQKRVLAKMKYDKNLKEIEDKGL